MKSFAGLNKHTILYLWKFFVILHSIRELLFFLPVLFIIKTENNAYRTRIVRG